MDGAGLFIVRPTTDEDCPGIARVLVDTWRTAYQGIVSSDHLAGLSYERAEESARKRLADPDRTSLTHVAQVLDGTIIGCISGGPARELTDLYASEIYSLYVLKEYQKLGVGRSLVKSIAQELKSRSMTTIFVWTLENNPARKFYERLGGTYITSQPLKIGDGDYIEVAYGWNDISVLIGGK